MIVALTATADFSHGFSILVGGLYIASKFTPSYHLRRVVRAPARLACADIHAADIGYGGVISR